MQPSALVQQSRHLLRSCASWRVSVTYYSTEYASRNTVYGVSTFFPFLLGAAAEAGLRAVDLGPEPLRPPGTLPPTFLRSASLSKPVAASATALPTDASESLTPLTIGSPVLALLPSSSSSPAPGCRPSSAPSPAASPTPCAAEVADPRASSLSNIVMLKLAARASSRPHDVDTDLNRTCCNQALPAVVSTQQHRARVCASAVLTAG